MSISVANDGYMVGANTRDVDSLFDGACCGDRSELPGMGTMNMAWFGEAGARVACGSAVGAQGGRPSSSELLGGSVGDVSWMCPPVWWRLSMRGATSFGRCTTPAILPTPVPWRGGHGGVV